MNIIDKHAFVSIPNLSCISILYSVTMLPVSSFDALLYHYYPKDTEPSTKQLLNTYRGPTCSKHFICIQSFLFQSYAAGSTTSPTFEDEEADAQRS